MNIQIKGIKSDNLMAKIEADCASDCDTEFTRGYVQEALIKLMSEAIASSILNGVEIGDASELNVTIVNK